MQIVGLTGSIAMGKSHTARMFKRFGVPVFDSDAAVHLLFGADRALPKRLEAEFGDVLDTSGNVDRQRLGAKVLGAPEALKRLEGLVHPAVHAAQRDFLKTAARQRHRRAVLDIPLLFEGSSRGRFDAIITVACNTALQRQRALARPGMNEAKFKSILSKQMPVAEKRKRADRVITSGYDRGSTFDQVSATLDWLDQQPARAWPWQ